MHARGIALSEGNLTQLAAFCFAHYSSNAAPWAFTADVQVTMPAGASAKGLESALVTWAMAKDTDWSWHETTPEYPWRAEQQNLIDLVAGIRPDSIAMVEGGTGIGKTRAFAHIAAQAKQSMRVIIAVPTLAVAAHWREDWALFSPTPLCEVWGKGQYGEDLLDASEKQATALLNAGAADAVLCTHQMIPKVLESNPGNNLLLVDEAHLLSASLSGLAGHFYPSSVLGQWVQRWCEQQTLPGTDDGEIEVGGRMRDLIVHRLVPEHERGLTWRASIITRQDEEAIVWVRHANSVNTLLAQMWQNAKQALLFSGTLSWQSSAGVRSTHHLIRRLSIPEGRAEDLGRVRAPWRDQGVTVLRPERRVAQDKKMWLGAYRGREENWWPEAAQALIALRKRPGKTLVLMNSYADIEGIRSAMGKVAGVVASGRGESIEIGMKQLARKNSWCWLATGAAWTGMDATVPLQRVVVVKLPLPDPQAMRLMATPQDAVFDAVCRFRQGVGRLVRSAGRQGLEIIVLDGRINDPSPRWRSICQPFLQVLGDEYEEHGVLNVE